MSFSIRNKAHRLLVRYPRVGFFAYELIRLTKGSGQKKFLKDFRERGFLPQSILDVGANRGEWSRNAKSVFKQANFHLIEPQIEMKPFLDQFCSDFPGSTWLQAGAGSQRGTLTLSIFNNLGGSSFLPSQSREFQNLEQRQVPIITIDGLIEQNEMPIPDLVKIDVQGFELQVLKGARSCFGQTEVFILEVAFFSFLPKQPLFHEVIRFMFEKGYVVYDILHLSRRPLDGALAQADVCFVKQDGMLRKNKQWEL